MKRYIEQENGYLVSEGTTYPNNHHAKIRTEVEAGEAEIIPFDRDSYEAEQLVIEARRAAKQSRDNALDALVYDFGDGRVIQTRPKDESNIRNAIEIMEANLIASIGWVMQDNSKQAVTAEELKAALEAGQFAAMQVWDSYNPE